MSKEFRLSRRENGLTIKYLAQVLVNDIVFPNQEGIRKLLSKCKRVDSNNKEWKLSIDDVERFQYYFLFHMEDFGTGDKSEIDLLIRQGKTLFAIEVKAFTNPNATNVKREIVRNHSALEKISAEYSQHSDEDSKFFGFDEVTEIISILLYSKKQHLFDNSSAEKYNYFNEKYLVTKNIYQKEKIDEWHCFSYKMPDFQHLGIDECNEIAEKINEKLYFMSWEDVYKTMEECNHGKMLCAVIEDLLDKKCNKTNVRLV